MAGIVLLFVVLGRPLPDRLQDLAERNAGAASYVDGLMQLVGSSEPDAVFLAYNANDAIAYYGQRVTLFYRRTPPKDLVTGTCRWDELELRLVEAVNVLLERDVPVYYVWDSDPPFADSFDILKRHFNLSPQGGTTPLVYRVQRSPVEWGVR